MGGKHTTFNMALWDKDFATEATAADLAALLSELRERAAADMLALTQQPRAGAMCRIRLRMLPIRPRSTAARC